MLGSHEKHRILAEMAWSLWSGAPIQLTNMPPGPTRPTVKESPQSVTARPHRAPVDYYYVINSNATTKHYNTFFLEQYVVRLFQLQPATRARGKDEQECFQAHS
ncbi:hypothetical protein E2C01_012568 [Portunus trituberculatus]|uniref:Uncharacterized protein n=1 Tax=Portunus trituberculatus TaxID=210409 RepID=A0A5B7DF25_PORTR|nr:hypothetical protein [Portunus trituberculatus]